MGGALCWMGKRESEGHTTKFDMPIRLKVEVLSLQSDKSIQSQRNGPARDKNVQTISQGLVFKSRRLGVVL